MSTHQQDWQQIGRTMKHMWVVFLARVYVDHKAGCGPICAHRQAGCYALSLADLFDRVIQQSARMHGISSNLPSEIEQYFLPMKNHIRKRKCHTFHKLTPDDKENAQRLASVTTMCIRYFHLCSLLSRVIRIPRTRSMYALALPPSSSEIDPMDHQYLIYCFRRDSNKVQSYLRILKYTILPEQGC
uniref:Uncharacterized protein n=1 Tax=Hucho hucho TaxID=62062 RepID=A0A4W5MX52_9TELE